MTSNPMGGERLRLSALFPGIGKADSLFLLEIRESRNPGIGGTAAFRPCQASFTDNRGLICCLYTRKPRSGSTRSTRFPFAGTRPVPRGGIGAQ